MNRKTMDCTKSIFQKFFLLLLLVLFLGFVSGEIIVTTQVEKKEIYPFEMNNLVIKILNDSPNVSDKLYLRIQGEDNIVFINEGVETKSFVKEILELKPNATKEIKTKFKATSTKKDPSQLFVYYGTENEYPKVGLPFVSGTMVGTKENKIDIITRVDKVNSLAGKEVTGSVSVSNKTGNPITMFASEMIVPQRFDLKSEPFFVETIDANTIFAQFNAIAPINVDGEHSVLIVYGYFDENGVGHYFEKEHKISFLKTNKTYLVIIGLVVLIIAVYLYLEKTKKSSKAKDTE
ncbi:MAG: hypothetical protein GX950_00660 [Candidatus Diapherotrites archaeon]|uniref:Uncharacterized protein n=1 Tax=Candidatus Iainarchaeum sp. TaxID=3101447 RepID=A0A7K4BYN3_9ARCH|nr:hypothetical protein [Candidatus Diapherotrites archaeon]